MAYNEQQMEISVGIHKLDSRAIIPKYAKSGDAGMDLTAISKNEVVDSKNGWGYVEYRTGLSFEIPKGFVGLIFPRSSISLKGAILSNSVGVIDSGYRGEVSFRFKQIPNTAEYEIGDRIGQIIIIPYPKINFIEKDEFEQTERGTTGFGSSGK